MIHKGPSQLDTCLPFCLNLSLLHYGMPFLSCAELLLAPQWTLICLNLYIFSLLRMPCLTFSNLSAYLSFKMSLPSLFPPEWGGFILNSQNTHLSITIFNGLFTYFSSQLLCQLLKWKGQILLCQLQGEGPDLVHLWISIYYKQFLLYGLLLIYFLGMTDWILHLWLYRHDRMGTWSTMTDGNDNLLVGGDFFLWDISVFTTCCFCLLMRLIYRTSFKEHVPRAVVFSNHFSKQSATNIDPEVGRVIGKTMVGSGL